MPAPKARGRKPKPSADTRRILDKLGTQHPNADTELNFTTPYELLVATILSAQCTDERVNQVTPALFKRYPDARALARATTGELEPQIQSTGFFRAKSKSLSGMAKAVVEGHGGEIPKTMDELVKLPGVGRKTANVVLGHALGVPGLPVDRHVLRVANRIGIATSEDPEIVEQQLCAALPPDRWTLASDTLILHGRRICKPKPLCDRCAVREECDYYRLVIAPMLGRATKLSQRGPRGSRVPALRAKNGSLPKPRRAVSPQRLRVGGAPTIGPESGNLPKPRRAAARQGLRGGGASTIGPESGNLPKLRRAAARQGLRVGGAPTIGPESGDLPKPRRAVARQGLRGGGAPTIGPESGNLPKPRRAAEPRGTGGGAGAPPRTKK